MILIDDTCYTCYQSIMQAAHSIVETCMPTLLRMDTVTAHIIYTLHQQTCCLLIMHILHDIDLSWSLPWHRSLMHACCLVKMLSIYNNDTVHMVYVTMLSTDHAYTNMTLNTYACYQSIYIHCISLIDAYHRSMVHPVHIIRCMLHMFSTRTAY